ncbi:MAG TPA: hypothetical protein VKJ65_00880 [Phycisphaerae bacterium]|nr:hypothetical protein [Phycisphaerae bacterium]
MMLTDSELLAAYVAKRDQDALRALLQRHLGLVYAAGDPAGPRSRHG